MPGCFPSHRKRSLPVVVQFINSLQFKLAVGFLLVALMPLGIVGVFAVRTANQIIQTIVTNQLENVAAEKQQLLQRWLSERKADMEVVAGSAAVRSLDPKAIADHLKLVQREYLVYRQFVVAGSDGKVVFSTAADGPAGLGDHAWFQQAMAGRRYMSAVRLDDDGQESVFQLASPIPGPDGKPQGGLCATVSTAGIRQDVLKVSLGETGECYLVDKTGPFLAHNDPHRILRDNIAESESFANIFREEDRRPVYTDYRKIAVLGASRAIPDTEWYVVVEQDEAEAFAPSYQAALEHLHRHRGYGSGGGGHLAGPGLLRFRADPHLERGGARLGARRFRQPVDPSRQPAARRDRHVARGLRGHGRAAARPSRQAGNPGRLDRGRIAADRHPAAAHDPGGRPLRASGRVGPAGLGRGPRDPHSAGLAEALPAVGAGGDHHLAGVQPRISTSPCGRWSGSRPRSTTFSNFARPQEPVLTKVDFRKLVDDALMVVRPRANHQEVTARPPLRPRLAAVVLGDMRQLGEALVNLLVNALEEMPDGGSLTRSADPAPTAADGDGGRSVPGCASTSPTPGRASGRQISTSCSSRFSPPRPPVPGWD